jgi:precorrin-6Y C5,15-methyltransferase (decarboxylating)
VTADSDAVLLGAYRQRGGELSRIGVEIAEPIGRFVGYRPLRSVTAWAATKD